MARSGDVSPQRYRLWSTGLKGILAALLVLPSSLAAASSSVRSGKRIVATGDIHADLSHAHQAMHFAGLVAAARDDANLSADDFVWTGDDAVWVQTGDLVDRGRDTLQVFKMVETLRERVGDQIVSLLGNHEYMNAMGDWRYVNPEDIKDFGSVEERAKAFSSTGWIGRAWLEHYRVAAVVDWSIHGFVLEDDLAGPSAAFVHGGLSNGWTNVSEVNEVGASVLTKFLAGEDMHNHTAFSARERSFYSDSGPLWYRGFSTVPTDRAEERRLCDAAQLSMDRLHVSMLVMGHTPQLAGITTLCQGRVVLIDTGLTASYGGRISSLEMTSRVERDSLLEVMTALYADTQERTVLWQRQRRGHWLPSERDREL